MIRDDPTDASAQRDLSISLNHTGEIAALQGQIEPAQSAFDRALEIRRALSAGDESSQVAKVDVAQSLLRLGELKLQVMQRLEAERFLFEAMAILKPLQEANKLQSAADQLLLETIHKHLARTGDEPSSQ